MRVRHVHRRRRSFAPLASTANAFSATLDFTHYAQVLITRALRDVEFRESNARAAEKLKVENFTVVFYGLRILCCKTAQRAANAEWPKHLTSASLCNVVKNGAKIR